MSDLAIGFIIMFSIFFILLAIYYTWYKYRINKINKTKRQIKQWNKEYDDENTSTKRRDELKEKISKGYTYLKKPF